LRALLGRAIPLHTAPASATRAFANELGVFLPASFPMYGGVLARQAPLATVRGIEGPPTLAIEIVSPSTARIDRGAKLQLYARHGVPYYWIVDPEARSIEAYVLSEGVLGVAGRLAGADRGSLPPFPGLPIAVATLWA